MPIEKAFSTSKEFTALELRFTVTPREWLDRVGLSKVGVDDKPFADLLEAEGLMAEDFSGIRFTTVPMLREFGLRYGEIRAFTEAVEGLHKFQTGAQSTMMMNWSQSAPKPRVATSHKTNYRTPISLGENDLEFPARNNVHLQLTNPDVVGGPNWATVPRDPRDSSQPLQVSGVLVQVRFNIRGIYGVDTEKQLYKAHFIMEAFIDMSLHPGLMNSDGTQLNPSTWEPRLHFTNIIETQRWDCRPTILLDTETEQITSIRFKYTIQATFSEAMELKKFPFDVQALHMTLYSKRSNGAVTLCTMMPNRHTFQVYNMPEINTFDPLPMYGDQHFNGHGEYLCCKTSHSLLTQSSRGKIYPVMHVYCAMQRRSGYFLVNVFFPTFLITALAFASVEFGIDDEYDSLTGRMTTSLGGSVCVGVRLCVHVCHASVWRQSSKAFQSCL